MDTLEAWKEAIQLLQKQGTVNRIEVDKKTLDRLWWDMSQLSRENVSVTKRPPSGIVNLYGVEIVDAAT